MTYNKLTGVVLKKQNYREADQIVTIWTREVGKVRVMARGLKHSTSKLSYSMQDLSVVEFEVTGRKALPMLISAKCLKNFSALREDLSKTVSALYASELMMKMTPDEQPNTEAYDLLVEFLSFLNNASEIPQAFTVVDCFSLRLLTSLGFSIEHASGRANLPKALNDALQLLSDCQYHELSNLEFNDQLVKQSHQVVKNFIEFILERGMKSDSFLASI